MSLFSDDRSAELRQLFFESAEELLQSLNDAGLELEEHPQDAETIRRVRRAVHTLKGDSAACGYQELSRLAHELEDVLTPQVIETRSAALAEVVLTAADTFHAMLAAYRGNLQPPAGDALRTHIRHLMGQSLQAGGASPQSANDVAAKFEWGEYEQLMIAEAVHRGETVYNVGLRIDPASQMRAAALQLIRNVLYGAGTVLALRPEDNLSAEHVEIVEAALATSRSREWLLKKCRIPAVVSGIVVERAVVADTPEHEMIGALLDSEAAAVAAGVESARGGASPSNPAPAAKGAAAVVAEGTLRVESARIDAVMNLVGELIIGKSMFHRAIHEFDQRFAKDPLRARLNDALAFQSRVLDDLQKSVMKIRMVPVEQLFRRLPRIVRDVAKLRGRDVALELAGQNTDLDKGILDSLGEPLTHLIRNAVDHGIEPPEERVAAGKPARGTVRLNAYHQGNQVVIEIRDDGRGIDRVKIVAQAIERGILSAEEANRLTESEALNLIFESGLSTAEEITAVSGRGVGMDVVRTVLERLKGTVTIATQPGTGTTFQLRVPLTLASIQALLFRAGGRLYAVPLSSVLEITRAEEKEIHRVDQREVFQLRDRLLTLVRLDRLAQIHAVQPRKRSFVVVIGAAERRFGLVVDNLVGEEELVIKALGDQLVASELVSGASILGDGTVVLILNVPAVVTRLSRAPALEAIA
jgi:two-component system chemotaxis sensor kinase CheA